jgi:hypothetical protein
MAFRTGSIPAMAATAAGTAFMCTAIHFNGNKLV